MSGKERVSDRERVSKIESKIGRVRGDKERERKKKRKRLRDQETERETEKKREWEQTK